MVEKKLKYADFAVTESVENAFTYRAAVIYNVSV